MRHLSVNKEEAHNFIIDLFDCDGVITDDIITSSANGAVTSSSIQSPQVIHLDVLQAAVLGKYEATTHRKEASEYTYLMHVLNDLHVKIRASLNQMVDKRNE